MARSFAERHPDIVEYAYRTFATSRPRAFEGEQLELHPFGFDGIRHSVDVLLRLAAAQSLTTRLLTFDDLFGEAAHLLSET